MLACDKNNSVDTHGKIIHRESFAVVQKNQSYFIY